MSKRPCENIKTKTIIVPHCIILRLVTGAVPSSHARMEVVNNSETRSVNAPGVLDCSTANDMTADMALEFIDGDEMMTLRNGAN